MTRYSARTLLALREEEIWQMPDGPVTVEFDDGLLNTTSKELIFSWYFWVYHRCYPETPLCIRHHITGERLTRSTNLRLLSVGMKDCYFATGQTLDLEGLWLLAFETINHAYNAFTTRLDEYVTSVSILDYLEVMDHPEIKAANDNVKGNENSIKQTYQVIERVIMNAPELDGNRLANPSRSRLNSMGQVLQVVGPRGSLTDIDSTIFPHAILNSYMKGMMTMHDTLIESRSAGKSLMLAKDPLAMTEYFNRKMQLATVEVETVHLGDCGNETFVEWKVHANDLKILVGKHYHTDTGLLTVNELDHHLVGKVIKMRTVFGCRHPDPYGVCSMCMGDLAYSIPKNTNLGNTAAVVVCKEGSQKVLSNKHLESTANVDQIELSQYEQNWLALDTDESRLRFSDKLSGKKFSLRLYRDDARNIGDVNTGDGDVRRLPITRYSSLTDVTIVTYGELGEELNTVAAQRGSNHSSLTYEALEWVRDRGFTVVDGVIDIDFTGWDVTNAVFELPMKHVNMVDYMASIEKMIRSNRGRKDITLRSFDSPGVALFHLNDLVSSKLSVNIAYLEIIILSTMVKSTKDNDRYIPKGDDPWEFGVYGENMALRSITNQMAFQTQAQTINDPKSYIVKNRPRSPLDPLLI